MNRLLLWLLPIILCCLAGDAVAQSSYSLRSPDSRIEVRVRLGDRISYDVLLNNKPLLQDSTLSINIDRHTLGLEPKLKEAKQRSYDQWLAPPVRQKFAQLRDHYNELRLDMAGAMRSSFGPTMKA